MKRAVRVAPLDLDKLVQAIESRLDNRLVPTSFPAMVIFERLHSKTGGDIPITFPDRDALTYFLDGASCAVRMAKLENARKVRVTKRTPKDS